MADLLSAARIKTIQHPTRLHTPQEHSALRRMRPTRYKCRSLLTLTLVKPLRTMPRVTLNRHHVILPCHLTRACSLVSATSVSMLVARHHTSASLLYQHWLLTVVHFVAYSCWLTGNHHTLPYIAHNHCFSTACLPFLYRTSTFLCRITIVNHCSIVVDCCNPPLTTVYRQFLSPIFIEHSNLPLCFVCRFRF